MNSTTQPDPRRRRRFSAAEGTPPGSLRVTVHDTLQGAVVTLKGYLDLSTTPTLDAACSGVLDFSHNQQVAADLAQLSFCDSTGASTLLRFHRQAQEAEGWLRLCAAGPTLRRILRITDPAKTLRCYSSPMEAFADV
ncbi:STAS domain-containing protein [Catenulispora subtropica]|uniref:STAS domain-containing protein n=1 Tax=Catenulispora subtropica TaxID=450798 RepID=A0ABP5C4X9_9ACTN